MGRWRSTVRVFIYLMTYDLGFAPNPFHGYCTLATCKPGIRSRAGVGDWVIGVGSKSLSRRAGREVGIDKVVYAMRVDEVLTWREYSEDPRFRAKIPSYSPDEDRPIEERGDNIYYLYEGKWYARPSFHYGRKEEMLRDLRGNVLISREFYYFGRKAIKMPEPILSELKKAGLRNGYRPYVSPRKIRNIAADIIDWIRSLGRVGVIGEPFLFKRRYNEEFFESEPMFVCEDEALQHPPRGA